IKRTSRALELANTGIAVYTDQKRVTLVPSCFKIADMAKVQKIKATIRHDQFLACRSKGFAPGREVLETNDFAAKIQPVVYFFSVAAPPENCLSMAPRRKP